MNEVETNHSRETFTFWRSFRDAIREMPESEQLPLYRAIADFGLDGVEPTDLQAFGRAVWNAIFPTLRKGWNLAVAGSKGGTNGRGVSRNAGNQNAAKINSKTKAKQKQIKSNIEHRTENWELGTENREQAGEEESSPTPPRARATRDAAAVEALNQAFTAFWQAYPRKVGKKAARKAFDAAAKRKALPALPDLLAALDRDAASDQWTKDGGRYIPHPATWINGERWADETGDAPALPGMLLAGED